MAAIFVATAVEVAIATKAQTPTPFNPHPGQPGGGPEGDSRSGKCLILATRDFAQENRARSWWVLYSTLALTGMALLGALVPWAWPLRMLCSIVSGLLMVRLFVIYHDHQHHAILDRSFVADFLMRFIGILSLTPSNIWKHSHNYHHSHNSKLRSARIGSFPIMTQDHYVNATFMERFQYRFLRHPLTMLCGYITVFFIGMSILPFIENPRKNIDGLLAVLLHIAFAITLLLFGGLAALVFVLILPYTLASAFGAYLFYVQHNFPGVQYHDANGWTYEAAALDSSSYLAMPRILHWFTANIGYHHIHHLNPRIPFYRLPEVMRAVPELQNPKGSTLHPVDIWNCLRLTVWDVEAQRLAPTPRRLKR